MVTSARLRRRLSGVLAGAAILYPISLILIWLALRFAGERWWLTGVFIYLPAVFFALPLPFLALLLAVRRRWRLLQAQAISLLTLLFGLMGLNVSWGSSPPADAKTLRILSFNVDSGRGGPVEIAREIREHDPDVVFAQEIVSPQTEELQELLRPIYAHQRAAGEFLVASRFPILESVVPEPLDFYGARRSPRFMKVKIDTPLGPIRFFHVHPVSPRGGFYALRGQGLRREIMSGRLFTGANADGVVALSELRELQVSTFSEMAAQEPGPVVIVGDTNLPALSPVKHRYLDRFRDGFAEAGTGFGYTFPGKWPWMRIDRVLTSRHLGVSSFAVGTRAVSDHRSITAELFLSDESP